MSQKFNGAVTATGTSLIAEAVANNTKMKFLKIVGSTTKYTDEQLATLTDDSLISASHNQDGHVSNVTIKDKDTIATELVLDGNSVEADYQLNSVLILATVDGIDHLFGVLGANQPQFMNAYDGKSATNLEIQCSFKVANADHVDITVNSAGTLTVADYVRLQSYAVSQATSAQTSAYSHADSAVAAEAVKRSNADSSAVSAGTKALASEAAVRSTADSAESVTRLQADSAENLARVSADKSLATAVSAEAATRSGAAATAMSAVASEASARAAANSGEAATRSTADKSLAAAVSAEAGTRSAAVAASKSAEGSLVAADAAISSTAAVNLSNEIATRSAADSAEASARLAAISAEAAGRTHGDQSLAAAVSAEAITQSTADSAETSVRSNADKSLTSAVSAEAATRNSADSSLSARVASEANTRSAAIVAATSATNAEANIRSVADSAEVIARSNADKSISAAMSAETVARTSADEVNSTAASQAISAAAKAQSWSQDQISAAKNEISASVETVKQTVDNLSFSGRNLLPSTNQGLTNWTFGAGPGGSYNKDAFDVPNGKGMTMATTVAYTNWFYLVYKLNYKVLKPDTDYVLSFWARSDIDRRVDNVSFANGSGINIAAKFGYFDLKAKQKTRIVLKAATNDVAFTDQMLYLSPFTQIGGFDIWDLQLVEGTSVLYDWQPAPEDQATIDWTKSQLDIKDGKISAAVTSLKSDITNATAGMATQEWVQSVNGAIIDHGDDPNQGRGIDCPPSYYQFNYPAKTVREFKITGQMGVTLIDGQASDYGILTTKVHGANVGYGRPRQTFEPTLTTRPWTYIRIGTSDTEWSAWELVTTW